MKLLEKRKPKKNKEEASEDKKNIEEKTETRVPPQ
jgi:hypothetical protein